MNESTNKPSRTFLGLQNYINNTLNVFDIGSDNAIKGLVPLILTQGLEVSELGKHP